MSLACIAGLVAQLINAVPLECFGVSTLVELLLAVPIPILAVMLPSPFREA